MRHTVLILLLTTVSDACVLDSDSLRCRRVYLQDLTAVVDSTTRRLNVERLYGDVLDWNLLQNGTNLESISVDTLDAYNILPYDNIYTVQLHSMRQVSIGNAYINESLSSLVVVLTQWMPSLESLKLNNIEFDSNVDALVDDVHLRKLTCRRCGISNFTLPLQKLQELDLSDNNLRHVPQLPITLRALNISHNLLTEFNYQHLPVTLRLLDCAHNQLTTFDLSQLRGLDDLRTLNISFNHPLRHIYGNVNTFPTLTELVASNCSLRAFNQHFLRGANDNFILHIDGNPLWCGCVADWIQTQYLSTIDILCVGPPSFANIRIVNESARESCAGATILTPNNTIERFTFGDDAVLSCVTYPYEERTIRWYAYPEKYLGSSDEALIDEKFKVLRGGELVIREMNKYDIGRYICHVEGAGSVIVRVRLDYSRWLFVEVYSIVSACVTVAVFFAGHMLWTIIRRVIIWHIERSERTSRVRQMLEAVEKYRVSQMQKLHRSYAQKMATIRENYNAQVEQLWASYSEQTMRLKDYRDAQVESMTEHWGNIRDNYNWQVSRMRDYWRAQMERLGENYERQMNRLRTYSLQQRLKLARQYHLKQRYLNKLLDSLTVHDAGDTHESNHVFSDPNAVLQNIDLVPRAVPSFDAESSSVQTFYSFPDDDEVTTPFRSLDEVPTPNSPSVLVYTVDEGDDTADIQQTTSL